MLVFVLLLFVMSHLCASEFGMPYSWSRSQDDVKGHNFSVKVNPESGLRGCYVCGDGFRDLVYMRLGNCCFYFNMWCKGSSFVDQWREGSILDVSQTCNCCGHMSAGYVFNAPLSRSVGGLSVVPPIGKPVAPRFSQENSEKPKTFCDYCVDGTSFSAKMRLCEYSNGGFFFVRVKFMYADKNNVFVSWGEEMPCGRIKAESFDVCKFSFNTCTHINPHSSEGTEVQ